MMVKLVVVVEFGLIVDILLVVVSSGGTALVVSKRSVFVRSVGDVTFVTSRSGIVEVVKFACRLELVELSSCAVSNVERSFEETLDDFLGLLSVLELVDSCFLSFLFFPFFVVSKFPVACLC